MKIMRGKATKHLTKSALRKMLQTAKAFGLAVTLSVPVTAGGALLVPQQIVYAAEYTGTAVNLGGAALRVRAGAGTDTGIVTRVYEGDTFDILDTVYNGSEQWYQIGLNRDGSYITGYVSGEYVTVSANTTDNNNVTDNNNYAEYDFEAYLNEQGFPESYKEGLRQIHAAYPSWIFVADHISKDWSDIVAGENVIGRSTIYASAPDYWKSKAEGAYDEESETYIEQDSGGWVQASTGLVQYALDPRNFLNPIQIFMFEDLSYNPSIQNEQGVRNVIAGTFMDNSNHNLYYEGNTYDYPSALMYAGSVSGVSPYHLATRIIQEQGYYGQGGSISGNIAGYEGLFNYYNQGAYKTSYASAVENGLIYASADDPATLRPWDMRMKSIVGGAGILGRNYIRRGQDTLYYEKFDMISGFSHQYMTNILAPRSESKTAANAYSEETKQNTALVFTIPIYNSMPDTACPIPTSEEQNKPSADDQTNEYKDSNEVHDNPVVNRNGVVQGDDGGWYYYENNNVVTNYTGLKQNDFGWWYIKNGKVDFTYTGLVQNEFGWWYVENGGANFAHTGLVQNDFGWWYVENGGVNFAHTGLVQNEFGWWYVENGGVNFTHTGLVQNDFGWWYVENGGVNFAYTGLVQNEFGWWYIEGGAVNFNYTGTAANEYGTWNVINGQVIFE